MSSVQDAYENLRALAVSVKDSDLSAYNFVNDLGAKALLIAAAGELEVRLCRIVVAQYERHQIPDHLVDFVEKQALERKFHSLFEWNSNNSNKFLSLFGDKKKARASD